MRNDDNELVYVKVRPGRVVLERAADVPGGERRMRSFGGGQQFITTRGRAKSLAVDIEGPVVAPAADEEQQTEPAAAAGPIAPEPGGDGPKSDENGDTSPETAQTDLPPSGNADAPPAGDAEVSAAGDGAEDADDAAEDDAEDEGDEDEAEQDPSKRRKRARRGGHDRVYRGGHDRAV